MNPFYYHGAGCRCWACIGSENKAPGPAERVALATPAAAAEPVAWFIDTHGCPEVALKREDLGTLHSRYARPLVFGDAWQAARATPAAAAEVSADRKLINIALGLMDAPKDANLVLEVAKLVRPKFSAAAAEPPEGEAERRMDKASDSEIHAFNCGWRSALAAAAGPKEPKEANAFAEWLAREVPPGTVISDPLWWAPRILRAALASAALATPAAAPEPVMPTREEVEDEDVSDIDPAPLLKKLDALRAATSAAAEPDGEVISAHLDYATVKWLKPKSDPDNAWSWPVGGEKVYLVTPAAAAEPSTVWQFDQGTKDVWPDYIGGMIETYLTMHKDPPGELRAATIGAIIRRRMWSATPAAAPEMSEYMRGWEDGVASCDPWALHKDRKPKP